jgi:glucan phosphoethanolaminetransferase (alkaline phosphatase superfamily)
VIVVLSNAFNYVAGVASIISLILALTPFFPTYKTHIRYAAVFFIGVLLGSLFATASAQTIVFQFEGSVTQVMLLAAAIASLIIVLVIIVAVALSGEVKPSHSGAGASAAALFILMMVMYGISNWRAPTRPSEIAYTARDTDEFLALARYYREQGNKNMAFEYFGKAFNSAPYRDEIRGPIKQEWDGVLGDNRK